MNKKMQPRVEQLHFGAELIGKINEMVEAIKTIEDLQALASKFEELEVSVQNLQKELTEFKGDISKELDDIETIPNLIVLEDTIQLIGQKDFFLPIPSKAVEIKTVKFSNNTNTDNVKIIISENNNFSTEDYSSLEKQKSYDILNLPIVDQNNNANFKLKIRFENKTSSTNLVNVNYKIKLTIFTLK